MKATIEYVKQKFQEYNDLCFEGKLKPLPIRLSSARTFLGQVSYRREKNPDGTWHYFGFIFRINTLIDLSEQEVEDVIIHEMIHYYILSNQIQDTSIHGVVFTRMMKEINAKYNRHITVSHKVTKEEQDNDTRVRQHLVCVVRLRNNQRGVAIAARSRIFQLWDEIPRIPSVAECSWYVSTDPFFNRYPRVQSLKIYPIAPEELEHHLEGAKPLVKAGNTIKVKR